MLHKNIFHPPRLDIIRFPCNFVTKFYVSYGCRRKRNQEEIANHHGDYCSDTAYRGICLLYL